MSEKGYLLPISHHAARGLFAETQRLRAALFDAYDDAVRVASRMDEDREDARATAEGMVNRIGMALGCEEPDPSSRFDHFPVAELEEMLADCPRHMVETKIELERAIDRARGRR